MSQLNNASIHWFEKEREKERGATASISVWTQTSGPLGGFSANGEGGGGLFESAIYQLRANQNWASSFLMQNLTFSTSQLDLLKHD